MLKAANAPVAFLQIRHADQADAMVFVVVGDEVESRRFQGILASEERDVEIAHFVELVRPEDDMGEFDRGDDFDAGAVEVEIGTHFLCFVREEVVSVKCEVTVLCCGQAGYMADVGRIKAFLCRGVVAITPFRKRPSARSNCALMVR